MVIGFLEAKMASDGRVMSIMQEGKTKLRVSRDANKYNITTLSAENTFDERIFGRWTSLEAAFIDWLKTWVPLITIYQALPEPGFQLDREGVDLAVVRASR